FAAAGLSGASPTATGFSAFKLALAGFIIPFLFVYSPTLLFSDDAGVDIPRILVAFLAVGALTAAVIGTLLTKMAVWERVATAIAASLLILPGWPSSIMALVVLGIVIYSQTKKTRRSDDAPLNLTRQAND